LGGCSWLGGLFGAGGDTADNDLNKDAEQLNGASVDLIYADAWQKIRDGDWTGAAKQFDEVEKAAPLFGLGTPRDVDECLLLLF